MSSVFFPELKASEDWAIRHQAPPVSATLRSVWRKAQMMESMTSLSCPGDIANSVEKQALVIARSSAKNCSRCSG